MLIIQMHTGGGLFSRLIRWFTRAEYSHVSAWFWDANDPHGGVVLEAMEGKGVRELKADQHRQARNEGRIVCYTFRVPLSAEEQAAMLADMREEIGAKYDWKGVFKFITRRKHADDDKWLCSEYFAYFARKHGRALYQFKPAWDTTPGDIPESLAVVRTDNPEAHV